MSYDICNVCGKFFPKDGNISCEECITKDQEDFEKLRQLVRANPGLKVFEASNLTSIPVNTIMRFVKERRIFISSENDKDSGKIHFRDTPRPERKKSWERD